MQLGSIAFGVVILGFASVSGPAFSQDLDIRKAFLERYLDCAEAPTEALRLDCYDALLVDIPEWIAAFEQVAAEEEGVVPNVHDAGCGHVQR